MMSELSALSLSEIDPALWHRIPRRVLFPCCTDVTETAAHYSVSHSVLGWFEIQSDLFWISTGEL